MDIVFKLEDPQNPLGKGHKSSPFRSFGNVIVLAKDFNPSKAQIDLLNKGLTFIPSLEIHKNHRLELQNDIQNYHRKLKLAYYFKDSIQSHKIHFLPKSLWTPTPDKIPLEIHDLISTDLKNLKIHCPNKPEKHNLSTAEVKALRELIHNKNIVIKPADKGSSVVILSREQYVQEALRQLNNSKYYTKLDKPIFPDTIKMIKNITQKLFEKNFINKKQKNYLDGDGTIRERRFYMLPKVHKEPKKWNPPYVTPPGRPIVSDSSSESYQTAEYLEYFLGPLSNKHQSYLKDTFHFVQIIKTLQIPIDSYLFTLDIDSLYTNIDTTSGIQAVRKVFQKYPDKKRPDKELIELLRINLIRNDFMFNNQFYLQIRGTAMGKKFAPSYANIFMGQWEEEALAKCPKKPIQYFRYLDDIFGVWTHSEQDFSEFFEVLNSHDPCITLKHTFHPTSIDFLDTTIYKGEDFFMDRKLQVKVFFKETDTHALLHKSSFHPKHTHRGLVKSQLLRFYRICSNMDNFWEATQTLFASLRKRGYSRSFLRNCCKNFQIQKEKDQSQIIPLIIKFSTNNSIIGRSVKKNFQDKNLTQLIPNHKLIIAYKRNKNLSDFLIRAKLPSPSKIHKTNFPDYFSNLKFVRNQKTKTLFRIPQKFSPKTFNCIYMIYCIKCSKQYIGETYNSLSTRMWQHKHNIIRKKETHTPLVSHFIWHGFSALRLIGIQHNISWSTSERKKMERKWIYLLNTKEPFGLNQKWSS